MTASAAPSAQPCSWSYDSLLLGTWTCENPADLMLTLGCVHEHLSPSLTCNGCAPAVREQTSDGKLFCSRCRDDGGQDRVPVVLVEERPLDVVPS